jgi:putative peptidoglycan lipid II flippase
VPTLLYDLQIRGLVESALVPIFSSYSGEALAHLYSASLTVGLVVFGALTLTLELAAPHVALLMSAGSSPEVLAQTTQLLRITVPGLLFLSLSGVLSAVHFAQRRFIYPAFAVTVLNAGICVSTLLLHAPLGITAMALGVVAGALLQFGLQVIGMLQAGLPYGLRLWHPALRQVAKLYLPIIVGLMAEVLISRPISYNLASHVGEGGIAHMDYALTLRQLPEGLVALAISLAVLPVLARLRKDLPGFRALLLDRLRLMTVLTLPISIGLIVLASPLVALIFQHGSFTASDTQVTAQALRWYLLGLPFSSIDLLLVYAFYARQNTLTPALIGVVTTAVYVLVAAVGLSTWGLFSLMIADSLRYFFHAAISGILLWRSFHTQKTM